MSATVTLNLHDIVRASIRRQHFRGFTSLQIEAVDSAGKSHLFTLFASYTEGLGTVPVEWLQTTRETGRGQWVDDSVESPPFEGAR